MEADSSQPMTDYDVIIAGGGPAGLATAISMVRFDPSMRDRILVLERERQRKDNPGPG